MGKVITTSNGGDFTPVRMFKEKILNILSTWNQTQRVPRVPITSFLPEIFRNKSYQGMTHSHVLMEQRPLFLPTNEPIVFLVTGKTLDFPSQLVIFYAIFLHLVHRWC